MSQGSNRISNSIEMNAAVVELLEDVMKENDGKEGNLPCTVLVVHAWDWHACMYKLCSCEVIRFNCVRCFIDVLSVCTICLCSDNLNPVKSK